MRFLADAGISPRTVDFLRRCGHDAVHVRELALQRADPRRRCALSHSAAADSLTTGTGPIALQWPMRGTDDLAEILRLAL